VCHAGVPFATDRLPVRHQRGETLLPSPESWHCLKSIGLPHFAHWCDRSNSSEKISFSAPHAGQLQVKDFRLLKLA
jgi:hypothetical protein